jgi:hypothetical protein
MTQHQHTILVDTTVAEVLAALLHGNEETLK